MSFVNSKTIHKLLVLSVEDKNQGQSITVPQWWQQGWRQTIHGPTYSVARV